MVARINPPDHTAWRTRDSGGHYTVRKLAVCRLASWPTSARWWCRLMVFLVGNVVHLSASPGAEPASEGLLARRARMEAAVRAIPFPHLGEDTSLAIREVIDNPSYFRHTPTKARTATRSC